MVEAVKMIEDGTAPHISQEGMPGASYEPIMKKELAALDLTKSAQEVHNFIRGCDRVPGAWLLLGGEQVTVFGSAFAGATVDVASLKVLKEVAFDGVAATQPGRVCADGLLLQCGDGQFVRVDKVEYRKKTVNGSAFLLEPDASQAAAAQLLELKDEDERSLVAGAKDAWQQILGGAQVSAATDFFEAGAGSMDVTALCSRIEQLFAKGARKPARALSPDDVYAATKWSEFERALVLRYRGDDAAPAAVIDLVRLHANDMDISFPHQLFINGEFVNAKSGHTSEIINPTTEQPICKVALGGVEDINAAVAAAKAAFATGSEWRSMNARDRGRLMFQLADLMEEHKAELATIESLDSGAVYTLALKTHVGMSIDVFRYMAGWCDKIEGRTIPINNARPSRNLCITKREPMGVVGLIVPWNYPLMMLAWKMSAALAAGNTVVIKPANVTPLTALKFAELVVKAGFPKGVINVVPGAGRDIGKALATHPDVRKLGFTGSTEIGKQIMGYAAHSNLKKVSLELGGKSPMIVFADADMEKAVRGAGKKNNSFGSL